MKSCKAVWWLFPIITNTGLSFRGVTGKFKRDHVSHSLFELTSYFSLFCPLWEIQLSIFSARVKEWAFQVYPKAPERKWAFPSVGNTVCLWFHNIPAAIESQCGTIPRKVSRISIQSTEKGIQSKWMIGLVSHQWHGVWTAKLRVNSHRRCWGRWSMRWYRSSRQAVGWSTYFFPPESDCFCWRPVDKNNNRWRGERERSQYGLVCDTWIKWLFSPDGKGKANPSSPIKEKKEQHKSMGGRSVNETYISQSKVKAFANRLEKR